MGISYYARAGYGIVLTAEENARIDEERTYEDWYDTEDFALVESGSYYSGEISRVIFVKPYFSEDVNYWSGIEEWPLIASVEDMAKFSDNILLYFVEKLDYSAEELSQGRSVGEVKESLAARIKFVFTMLVS